jgi:signal transduction histidine kinase
MTVNYTLGYFKSVYSGAFIAIIICIATLVYFKLKKQTLGGYIAVLGTLIGTSVTLYLEGQLSFTFSYYFAIVFSTPFLIKRNIHFAPHVYRLSITIALVAITTLIISPELPIHHAISQDNISLKLRFNAAISILSILFFATLIAYAISHYIFILIKDKQIAEFEKDKRMTALYSLGHELRTQINSINGITQLVTELNNTPNSPPGQLKQYATILDGCNDQMLQLVNDVLDVHKIESGKLELLYQTRNLNKIVGTLANKYKTLALHKGLEFKHFISEELSSLYLRVDHSRLTQVLENLLTNAIKYTKEGSIELHTKIIEDTPKTATITFAVKDTGVGISREHYNTIFESFQKIKNDESSIYGGTGLGLSLTKAILEKMGSEIQVVSTLNKGTTFSFSLTLDKAHRSLKKTPLKVKKVHETAQRNILIAEDNTVSMMYTNTVLKNHGMSTFKAANGQEAIDIVKNNTLLDTVLLDLEMPVLNGYEAIKEIKKIQPDLIVIAFTATKPEKGFIDELYKLGFNDYLIKPFKKEELLDVIEKN